MSIEHDSLTYEHSEAEANVIGEAAIAYIYEGSTEGLPLCFRGLSVFGVAAALRERDDELHGELSTLDKEQRERLLEIEGNLEHAVDANLQYYPFGHNRAKYDTAMAGFLPYSSWDTGIRDKSRRTLMHEVQQTAPELVEGMSFQNQRAAKHYPYLSAEVKPQKQD